MSSGPVQGIGHFPVIGVDAHKRTHTLAVVDEVGRELANRTFRATLDGHRAVLRWIQRWPERMFALEDCRHLTRRLEADLIGAGEAVVRVPARLMATARRTGRELGKSDPIDALAVARAALREPGLPVAQLDGETRRLRLLVDHREDLVAERTRMQSRLRWHVHELFPGLEIAPKALGGATSSPHWIGGCVRSRARSPRSPRSSSAGSGT
jgi:transposase